MPSIQKKGETTFNLIGLVLDGSDEPGGKQSIIIDSNISKKNADVDDGLELCGI